MVRMVSVVDISPAEREHVRVDFYRAHRRQEAFSSVAVRRDSERSAWFLEVGATGPVDVPQTYAGLAVRVKPALGAINAVGRLTQAV
jgi:hypothetical protein